MTYYPQLLPNANISGLAFDAGSLEYHSFYLRPPVHGPATVSIKWYRERSNLGRYCWAAKVIFVPACDVVDIPMPEEFRHGDWPSIFIPDQDPDNEQTLDVDFSDSVDTAILVIYRDSSNPADTAIGDAMMTDVMVRFETAQ
jgi:hypothetical protein